MQALLLSPATRFSPDSSSSSPSSPATPPPPSLDFLLMTDSPLGQFDTPTRVTPQQSTLAHRGAAPAAEPDPPATPSWLRPELDEEWCEPDDDEQHAVPAEHSTASTTFALTSTASAGSSTVVPPDHTLRPASPPAPSSSSTTSTSAWSTPTRAALPDAAYASLTKTQPRVPSSLRHAFTASTASTATATSVLNPDGTRDMSVVEHDHEPSNVSGGSVVLRGPHEEEDNAPADDSVGSAGTCVVNSIVERSSGALGGAQDDGGQLAAAVRALRGPNAGLFSAPAGGGEAAASEGEKDGREEAAPQSKVGLMGLFEPPSPPVQAPSLPPSTHAAPSLPLFTFSPPDPVPRTSWKSLPLLSPSPSPPRTDNDATPVAARSSTRGAHPSSALETPHAPAATATPVHRAGGAGPAPTGPGRRDRFLKRSAPAPEREPVVAAELEPQPEQSEAHESSDDAPFVPPPHTGATTSESDEASEDDVSDEEEGGGSAARGDFADALGLAGPGQPGLGWSSDEDEGDHDESRSSFVRGGDVSPPSRRSSAPALPSPPVAHSSIHLGLPLPPSPRALPASPARIPFPSPALSAVGSAATLPPPPSPLRLFQPTYDTLTRAHLAQLVDDIDDIVDNRETYLREGAPPPRHLSPRTGAEQDTSDEGFLGEEGEKRSAKRIRLSPRSERERARFGDLSILSEEPPDFAPGDDNDNENDSSLALRGTPSHRRRARKSTSPTSARRRSMTPALRRARAYTPSASTSALRSSGLNLPSLPALLPAPDSARSRGSSASGASSVAAESPRSPGGARSRESRMDEADAVMERIRARVEERDARRMGGERSLEQEDELSPASTARPRFARVQSTTPPSSPPPLRNPVAGPSTSTPEPAYFASVASASLRSVLSSPAPLSSSSTFAPAPAHLPPAPGSPSLALGLPPSVRAVKERGGSLGRRHFARTPIGASDKKRAGEGAGGRDGSSATGRAQGQNSLLKRTQARRLFGTDADDAAAARARALEVGGERQPEQPDGFEESARGIASSTEPSTASIPSVSTSAARPSGHARHPSLTTLNPASRDTQLLLASAGASAREKGLVFDAGQGRWIRTPRRVAAQVAVAEEEQEEQEAAAAVAAAAADEDDEDPFRDFSELRSANGSGVAAAPLAVAADASFGAGSIDLDGLPRAGDGSGSLPCDAAVDDSHVTRRSRPHSRASAALDLSGLGITKGTAPRAAASTSPVAEAVPQPSPAGAFYFEGPPAEERPAEEDGAGPHLVLESEDSATWGRGGAQEKRRQAERRFDVDATSAVGDTVEDSEEDPLVESSMLGLYAAAHASPGSSPEVTAEVIVPLLPVVRAAEGVSPATPVGGSRVSRGPAAVVPALPVPRSALKPTRAQSAPSVFGDAAAGTSTPLRSTSEPPRVPRSVSFSDGKTSGKIEGLVAVGLGPGLGSLGSRLKFEVGRASVVGEPDASSTGASEGPGSLEFDEAFETQSEDDDEGEEDVERTVTQENLAADVGRSRRTSGIDAALNSLARGPDDTPLGTRFSRGPLGASFTSSAASPFPAWSRSRAGSRSFTRSHSQTNNATFLTECSFAVSHDRLVQYITDVEPFEPDWARLRSIDLSGKKADSVVRMKEFLPKLDEVNLNDNELSYLTGIPRTLRTLLVASNRLTSLTSFQHLANLERLDLGDNHLDSVHQLSSLRHLRELRLDGNQLNSLDGLFGLDSLVKLSLCGNALVDINLGRTTWSRLEALSLSRNQLVNVEGAERLVSLTTLDLGHNRLAAFTPRRPLSRLRVLRLGNNPLTKLDIAFAPKLRTLYVDSARLGDLVGTDHLRKLENLSVRDQSGDALTITMAHVRDVKRLYLSGNPLPTSFPSEKFYNLTYLELAMCQLESLPADFASVVPNVRVLNLDYNFIEDVSPLSGLTRLAKLSLVGGRIAKVRPLAAVLASLTELESVDLRMNPFTLAFYPPLVPPSASLLPSHAEHRILHPDDLPPAVPVSTIADPATHGSAWQALDVKFRRALPDAWYHRRAAYRAVVMQAVPGLVRLDGIDCAKERPRLVRTVDKLARQTMAAVER